MAKKKVCYAVWLTTAQQSRVVGEKVEVEGGVIFAEWELCKRLVDGTPLKFKGFSTFRAAVSALKGEAKESFRAPRTKDRVRTRWYAVVWASGKTEVVQMDTSEYTRLQKSGMIERGRRCADSVEAHAKIGLWKELGDVDYALSF